jgi:hypothetical protein
VTTLVGIEDSGRRRNKGLVKEEKYYGTDLAKTLKVQAESVGAFQNQFLVVLTSENQSTGCTCSQYYHRD